MAVPLPKAAGADVSNGPERRRRSFRTVDGRVRHPSGWGVALFALHGEMVPHLQHVFETPVGEDQIRAFQEWEQRNAARMKLRYADFPATSAFGLRPSDVVTLNRRMRFDFTAIEPRVLDESGSHVATLSKAPADLVRGFVAALDGRRSLAAICSEQTFAEHSGSLQALVEALLGGPFLISGSLAELEKQLPAVELLRFPTQSPYTMPREYWENSCAVRQALGQLYSGANAFGEFSRGLRGLHRLATIGANGRNYYGGPGGVPTVPGEFRTGAIRNRIDERKEWIFDRWLRLLDLPYALTESGSTVATQRVVLVRVAGRGYECHYPYERAGQLAGQLDEIRAHLAAAAAAVGADRDRLLRHCALFHHAFSHAHPFGNVNNSLAMNVVNDLLGRAGIGTVPHLYLDHLAYFLQPDDYVRFFGRAVEAHVVDDGGSRPSRATEALLEIVANAPAPAV